MQNEDAILSINGGSSSIKFALWQPDHSLTQLFYGEIENIGTENGRLNFYTSTTPQKTSFAIDAVNHTQAANNLIDWIEKQEGFSSVRAIGHRIVHGMKHTQPEVITTGLLDELKKISGYDPEHLPEEITLVEIFSKRYPTLIQVACFDTAFHTSMPLVAKLLSIPRRYFELGIQRYGFHGLSYAYLLEELNRIAGNEVTRGKIIMAHLGNGASLVAVKDGKSIDTSMGFTPTSGLMMGTRTGDLDPGVAWYLMQHEKLSPDQFSHLINHESGLLGISETSADMRALTRNEDLDNRADEAIELFCYQTKKWIGSFAAALGGLDILVFSGGIGEHSPEIRRKICDTLGFLGIDLDEIKNKNNETNISTDAGKVKVYVIKTNEELMIAKMVYNTLKDSTISEGRIIK